MLKTAQAISDLAGLGRGEARELLNRQVGRIAAAHVLPAYDPVFSSLDRQHRGMPR